MTAPRAPLPPLRGANKKATLRSMLRDTLAEVYMRRFMPVLFAPLALVACTQVQAEAPAVPVLAKAPASQPAAKAVTMGKGESAATRGDVDKDGVIRRGVALTAQKPLSVAECQAQAKTLSGKPVKVEGVVAQLCAKKGCWWVLGDEKTGDSIRITAKDYGFFVPKDATGKLAVAEGILEVKEMSDEERAHLAKDSGDPNAKIPAVELRLAASAVQMRPAKKK